MARICLQFRHLHSKIFPCHQKLSSIVALTVHHACSPRMQLLFQLGNMKHDILVQATIGESDLILLDFQDISNNAVISPWSFWRVLKQGITSRNLLLNEWIKGGISRCLPWLSDLCQIKRKSWLAGLKGKGYSKVMSFIRGKKREKFLIGRKCRRKVLLDLDILTFSYCWSKDDMA